MNESNTDNKKALLYFYFFYSCSLASVPKGLYRRTLFQSALSRGLSLVNGANLHLKVEHFCLSLKFIWQQCVSIFIVVNVIFHQNHLLMSFVVQMHNSTIFLDFPDK